jgi:acyl-CoA synthetase (AMP-forming)/AMP-acid ligase II
MLAQGIKPGELVAMYLWNSPEFYMIFFATLCIGAAPALINYNLEGKALLHCLDVCETKLLIIDAEENCQRRINESRGEIEKKGTKIVTLDADLKQSISTSPAVVPGDEFRTDVKPDFPYALIYTRSRLSSLCLIVTTLRYM